MKDSSVINCIVYTALLFTATKSAWAVDLGTHKGCSTSDADFEVVEFPDADGALKVAFDQRGPEVVDVYWVEKKGALKHYAAAGGTTTQIGQLPVATGSEDGLVGIELDPGFDQNRILYLMYSYEGEGESTYRISRFKLDEQGMLDMTSEFFLIKIPSDRSEWHTAGAMQFDDYGDLWIAIGDNEHIETGPANTSDLRGGILRIHPDSNHPKGYTIPKGNFGEHFAAKFRAEGKEALALEYEDPEKVRPEIYVKGTRNAYTITLDPVRRWLTWGDVGPDQGKVSEEHNFVTEPVYAGWPYFAGEEDMGGVKPYGDRVPEGKSRSGPTNTSGAGGVVQLPAITEPIFKRKQACAMTGPIFRYDGSNPSSRQFPPQFNRKWMISGCGGYGFHLLTMDEGGKEIVDRMEIFDAVSVRTLVDLKQGPDGALYFVGYKSGVGRIDYTGSCRDAELLPEVVSVPVPKRKGLPVPEMNDLVRLESRALRVLESEEYRVRLFDLTGREVLAWNGTGPRSYSLAGLAEPGVYQLLVETADYRIHRRISFISGP